MGIHRLSTAQVHLSFQMHCKCRILIIAAAQITPDYFLQVTLLVQHYLYHQQTCLLSQSPHNSNSLAQNWSKITNIPVSVYPVSSQHLYSEFPSSYDVISLLIYIFWPLWPAPVPFFAPKIVQKSEYPCFCVSNIILAPLW